MGEILAMKASSPLASILSRFMVVTCRIGRFWASARRLPDIALAPPVVLRVRQNGLDIEGARSCVEPCDQTAFVFLDIEHIDIKRPFSAGGPEF